MLSSLPRLVQCELLVGIARVEEACPTAIVKLSACNKLGARSGARDA